MARLLSTPYAFWDAIGAGEDRAELTVRRARRWRRGPGCGLTSRRSGPDRKAQEWFIPWRSGGRSPWNVSYMRGPNETWGDLEMGPTLRAE